MIGVRGYRDRNLLESAVGRPFATAFGKEAYSGLVQKSAALFHSLISNHPFLDGNKRTAVVALDHFLLANGDLIVMPDAEMYAFTMRVASYKSLGVAHGQIFGEIVTKIRESTVRISSLRKYPKLSALYNEALAASRSIRSHPLNKRP